MLNHRNIEEFYDPANYDLEEAGNSVPRIRFYVDLAQQIGGPALELACGSGLVTLPIAARGIPVIGVDLARPMLAHARKKAEQQGFPIDWIEADACQVHLGKKFSFIFLTGNAFQAFLSREDQERLLATIKRHLALQGSFAFETRNPSGHDLSDRPVEQNWFSYTSIEGHPVSVSGTQHFDPLTQVMHWTTYRRWSDALGNRTKVTRIACRFTYPQELEALLSYNGLQIVQQYGDWDKGPLTARSEPIISVCQHR